MTLEEMKKKKTELGLTSEMISQLSGVPLGTVQKIFAGTTKAPRRLTIEALEKVLDRSDEASQAFPAAQGRRYTLDDYYALPDEQRVELIDGVFYDIAAPSYLHQAILIQLLRLFSDCAEQHDMPCEVFIAPCDVRLDRDNYTMVQPDLLVICGKQDYLHMKRLEGAPDLAVEILSPSTRSKDMILKLYKYEKAGVREYWIVDPGQRTVTVHFFDTDHYDPIRYSFHDQIPVQISKGKCFIDFSRIAERLARYE